MYRLKIEEKTNKNLFSWIYRLHRAGRGMWLPLLDLCQVRVESLKDMSGGMWFGVAERTVRCDFVVNASQIGVQVFRIA